MEESKFGDRGNRHLGSFTWSTTNLPAGLGYETRPTNGKYFLRLEGSSQFMPAQWNDDFLLRERFVGNHAGLSLSWGSRRLNWRHTAVYAEILDVAEERDTTHRLDIANRLGYRSKGAEFFWSLRHRHSRRPSADESLLVSTGPYVRISMSRLFTPTRLKYRFWHTINRPSPLEVEGGLWLHSEAGPAGGLSQLGIRAGKEELHFGWRSIRLWGRARQAATIVVGPDGSPALGDDGLQPVRSSSATWPLLEQLVPRQLLYSGEGAEQIWVEYRSSSKVRLGLWAAFVHCRGNAAGFGAGQRMYGRLAATASL